MAKAGQNAKTKVEEYKEYSEFEYMNEIGADALITEYRAITDEIDRLTEQKKLLGPVLEAALTVCEQKAVRYKDLLLIGCNGTTERRISREKLILHGVDPTTIQECETGGTSYTYVQVKRSTE